MNTGKASVGRPPKNNADYFPHEVGMRNDRKSKAVRAKFGIEGYAVYCMLLESLAEADLICIEMNDQEVEMIAGDFGIDSKKLVEMIDFFVKIKLMQRNKKWLFCEQLDGRLKRVFDRRRTLLCQLRRDRGIMVDEITINVPETTPSIVKYSKEEESIGEKAKKNPLSSFLIDGEFETITGVSGNDPEMMLRIKMLDYFKIWKEVREPIFGEESWETPSERDYGFLKQIISMSGDDVEIFRAKAKEYLKSDQDFYRKVGWNLQTFVSNWAELGLRKRGTKNHTNHEFMKRKIVYTYCTACEANKKEDCHCE